jgi:hypothetical protein
MSSSSRPRYLWAKITLGALLVGGIGGLLAARPVLGWLIRQEARGLGVELQFDNLTLRQGAVELEHPTFVLTSTGLWGSAATMTLHVEHLALRHVEAEQLQVVMQGAPSVVVSQLAGWLREQELNEVTLAATNVSLRGVDPQGGGWFSFTGATVSPQARGGLLSAPSFKAGPVVTGPGVVRWVSDPLGFTLGVGAGDPQVAPLRVELPSNAPVTTIRVQVAKLSTAEVFGLFHQTPAPALRRATVDASLELRFPSPSGEQLEGKVDAWLNGYVPPHPPELDTVFASNRTHVRADLQQGAVSQPIQIKQAEVNLGELTMKGSATLALDETRARLKGRLDGALSCSMLARNAAVTNLGGLLGGLVGEVAGAAVGGTVNIGLPVDMDSGNPSKAQFSPQVGVGCGLKGL